MVNLLYKNKKFPIPTQQRSEVIINSLTPWDVRKKTKLDSFFHEVYAGYVGLSKGKLFYTLIEARSGNECAPVIVWFMGGPGAPSCIWLVEGIGPYRTQKLPDGDFLVTDNDFSWANDHTVILIDQPRGTGYSQVVDDDYARTNHAAAVDAAEAIQVILEKYQKARQDLYVSGVSYAGAYVPHTSVALMKRGIPVKGVTIGDGYVDPITSVQGSITTLLARGFLFPTDIPELEKLVAEAELLIQQRKYREASDYFDDSGIILTTISNKNGLTNWFDLTLPFSPEIYAAPIFAALDFMERIRTLLPVGDNPFNVDPASGVSLEVYNALHTALATSSIKQLRCLMDRGVNILLYTGENDAILPTTASDGFWRKLNLTGSTLQQIQKPSGDIVGYQRHVLKKQQKIMQAVILGSGHLVTMNQPEASLVMLQEFLKS